MDVISAPPGFVVALLRSASRMHHCHEFGFLILRWLGACTIYTCILHYEQMIPLLFPLMHMCTFLLRLCHVLLVYWHVLHPRAVISHSASISAPYCFCSRIEISKWSTNFSMCIASIGNSLASIVMQRSDLTIILQFSIPASCNRLCHHSISSSGSDVQELSFSHEILLPAVEFTRS